MNEPDRRVTGYRELSQPEVDLMNKIKQKGVELEELCAEVGLHVDAQYAACHINEHVFNSDAKRAEFAVARGRLDRADPNYWLDRAKGDLQVALMLLVRAVAQPITF